MNRDPYVCYRTACRYHSGDVSGSRGSCNYFFITGETKTSRGEADITRKCGLYKPGKRPQLRPQPVVLRGSTPKKRRRTGGRKYDWGQFRALWEEGKTDREIAESAGCSKSAVEHWRRCSGLACRRKKGGGT